MRSSGSDACTENLNLKFFGRVQMPCEDIPKKNIKDADTGGGGGGAEEDEDGEATPRKKRRFKFYLDVARNFLAP